MMTRGWATGLLLAWMLSGCMGQAVALDPTPTEAAAPAAPTATPEPAQTAAPTGTAAPTLTFTATLEPSATSTPLPDGALVELEALVYSPWELVHDLAWSADGRWLAVAAGEVVRLYDGGSLALVSTLAVGAWVSELAFAPLGSSDAVMLALAARDGSLQMWDALQGLRVAGFHAHNKGANSLAFSQDGQLVASAGNDAILRLWRVQDLLGGEMPEPGVQPVAEMIGGAFAVPAVRFSSPQGGILLASVDLQAVRLRDPATTRLVRTLRGEASVFALAFHPEAVVLAAAEDSAGLRLWDIASGEQLDYWQVAPAPEGGFLWDVDFSPDGSRLAAVSSWGGVAVWGYPGGEELVGFQGHSRGATAVAFSPDGYRLATGGLDGVVRVWALP